MVDGREKVFDSEGFFLGVSLIDNVSTDMSVYRDEIFGPVLSVVRVATFGDAIDMIDANAWGNGTAIYARDGGAARQFQQEVEAGMVGINVPVPVPVGYHSFGGSNDSFFGDTTMYGPEGIRSAPAQGHHITVAGPGHKRDRSGLSNQHVVPDLSTGPKRLTPHSVALTVRKSGHRITDGSQSMASTTPLVSAAVIVHTL